MPMTRYDINLLNAMKEARERCADLSMDDESDEIREIAVGLLERTISSYETAIERDTTEVQEAAESREHLQATRGRLNRSFEKLRMALQMEFNRRRLEEESSEDIDSEVARYLANYSAEDFRNSSLRTAISIVEDARDFAGSYLPEDYRDKILAEIEEAIDEALEAQERHRNEELDVVDSKSELEEERRHADQIYITVRHLVRAALRLADREPELVDIIPSLRQALQ
jgi:hypothetical protein